MNEAIASNWVAETCEATQTGFKLKGSSRGYTSFQRAFAGNTQVFYSVHDDNGNREAGYATFNGLDIENRQATATLYNGIYQDKSPQKIPFTGTLTIACTFNAVAFNALWKALNTISPDGTIDIPPSLINGLVAALDGKANVEDLRAEVLARIAADQNLQDQIDSIEVGDGGGGGASSWDELTGKPIEFPPEAHTHQQSDVNGLEQALGEIDTSLDDLEAAIATLTSQLALGGSYDASTGLIIHGHLEGFVDGQPLPPHGEQPDHFVIVAIAGDKPEDLSEGDWLVAGEDRWVPIKYGTAGTVDWGNIVNAPDFTEEAPKDGEQYARQDGDWSVVESSGAGLVISDAEPADPIEGLQWLDTTSATVWIWDGGKWLQFPAGGSGYDDDEVVAAIEANAAAIEVNRGYIQTNVADIAKKLDADRIWTGTQDAYDALTPSVNTLYFITA